MNIRLQPPYKHTYSETPLTIETPQGIVFHVDHCLKGMNRFEEGSKEFKLFAKIFAYICVKASQQRKLESEIYKI